MNSFILILTSYYSNSKYTESLLNQQNNEAIQGNATCEPKNKTITKADWLSDFPQDT
jgi:hypothetical protein